MFSRNSYVKMMPDSDDGAASGGANDDANKDAATATQEHMALLTKSVGMLAEGLTKMEGNQAAIAATLASITGQSKTEVKEHAQEKFGDDIDLEQLDRRQFAALIMEGTKKALQAEMQKLMGDVDTRIGDLAGRFESKNASEQIAKTADDNPDFWEWSAEIKQLLQENPTLSVHRAYNLARAENNKKATELSKKYNPPKEKGANSFIALTPTSSIGTRESSGKMTQKEAAEQAFDTVMASLGDVMNNKDFKLS